MIRAFVGLYILTTCVLLTTATAQGAGPVPPARAPDATLFGFENAADAKNWSPLHDPKAKAPDPDAAVSWSNAAGTPALKITFNGGVWPAVTTSAVSLNDWTPFNALKVDVTTQRPCVVGFRAYSDKDAAADFNGHWETTAFLQKGRNSLELPIKTNAKFSGKLLQSIEIYMYQPISGESIEVGPVSLANVKLPPPPELAFSALGTALKVKEPLDLMAKLQATQTPPDPGTVEQVEAAFKAKYDALKKEHPNAVLAILRDGEKAWDPANPDKAYSGWKDSLMFLHPPDAITNERCRKYGNSPTLMHYSRNTYPRMLQADLTVIPKASTILAAQMILIRTGTGAPDQDAKPGSTMFVAEACNRDWDESEINAYQYAKDKTWKALGGASYTGDDPDFFPLYVAYGRNHPGKVNTWDFTDAVTYWTDGVHANHGFAWYCSYHEPGAWRAAPSRRAKIVKDRPALMVIYEPKP